MTKKERKAHKDRMEEIHKESIEIVSKGVCPKCGTKLVRNLALAGWWQCGCYGEVIFKKPENINKPKCSFQCFTE